MLLTSKFQSIMKKGLPLLGLAVASAIFLAGCKKDEEGSLKVTFRGAYGNDPLVMFDVHDYIDGQRIQFTRSEFFVSDLNLIDDAGNAYPLTDVELVDLTLTTPAAAEQGITFTFNNIPAGVYPNFEFGFGVASDVNATKPVDYPSSSPLSNAGRYWDAWTSYIFSKTEGNLDTIIDGVDNGTLGFSYHSGTDDLFRLFRINNEVSITDDGTTEILFTLDHEKLLGVPADAVNIKTFPHNHNPGEMEQVTAIINNVIDGLSYEIN